MKKRNVAEPKGPEIHAWAAAATLLHITLTPETVAANRMGLCYTAPGGCRLGCKLDQLFAAEFDIAAAVGVDGVLL